MLVKILKINSFLQYKIKVIKLKIKIISDLIYNKWVRVKI